MGVVCINSGIDANVLFDAVVWIDANICFDADLRIGA
jgi:hypothetical protein